MSTPDQNAEIRMHSDGQIASFVTCIQTCMQTQCSCRRHHTTAVFAQNIQHQVRHAHSDDHTDSVAYEHNHTIDASAFRALRSWLKGLASLLLAAGQWRCWKTAENACKAEPDFVFHLCEIWHSVNFTPSDTRIAYQELVAQVGLCLIVFAPTVRGSAGMDANVASTST